VVEMSGAAQAAEAAPVGPPMMEPFVVVFFLHVIFMHIKAFFIYLKTYPYLLYNERR